MTLLSESAVADESKDLLLVLIAAWVGKHEFGCPIHDAVPSRHGWESTNLGAPSMTQFHRGMGGKADTGASMGWLSGVECLPAVAGLPGLRRPDYSSFGIAVDRKHAA